MTKSVEPIIAELDRLRMARGIRQYQIAEHFGVVPAAVSLWHSGSRMPGLDTVREYAAMLGYELVLIPQGGEDE